MAFKRLYKFKALTINKLLIVVEEIRSYELFMALAFSLPSEVLTISVLAGF